ncbi:hypothetical protein Snoj_36110 [Streptomyces nojiriensis]|uniref:Uncharacterized protein n=1 Tax=Streptomyces nojiriensis TaxID=66374 RepID=A0ABQ3SNH5_9ACTN|nr:hypothetical protein JYK04_01010 [Streptomyces nojiriensis]GGS11624.1 hypothetical protein GCM10010205_46480 [Streptomyces nojiriensis]GHI69693.1 hypothetical protein Snoj_36110 [Streptomyces nojiriensis]
MVEPKAVDLDGDPRIRQKRVGKQPPVQGCAEFGKEWRKGTRTVEPPGSGSMNSAYAAQSECAQR